MSAPLSDVLDGVPWLWVEGLPSRNACAGFLRSFDWRAG